MIDTHLIRAIRILSFLAGLLVASLALAEARAPHARAAPASVGSPAQPAAPIDVAAEVSQLRSALAEEVPHLIADRPERKQEWIARTWAATAASGLTIDRPHLLVVVDRNPRVQQMRLILAHPQGEWKDLGGTKISTGQMGRYD